MRRITVLESMVVAAILALPFLFFPASAEAASLPRVGVVISQQTMDFGAFTAKKKGMKVNQVSLAARQDVTFRLFQERGFGPKDLSDSDLRSPRALSSLQVIVLPYTLVMDGKQAGVVRDFVSGGGGLIAIYQAPRLNGNGNPWLGVMKGAWGPLSAVYQIERLSDMNVAGYRVTAAGRHLILSRARAKLGYPLVLEYPGEMVLEKTRPLGSGVKVRKILSLTRGSPGAWAGSYGEGRFVYFTFPAMDFVWLREVRLRNNQGKIAEELLVQSAQWAAGK